MSGWHQDKPDDDDLEFRWLMGITILAALGVILWLVWPWLS